MDHILKLSAFLSFCFLLPSLPTNGTGFKAGIDKSFYYSVMSGDNLQAVNTMLTDLKGSSIPEKNAYEGALLMKKAGLVKPPMEKLRLFKAGRKLLEEAIYNDAGNCEYRFLRLIIQENSPKILKYKTNLQDDARIVKTTFKNLPGKVQQVVKDYSIKSAILKPADF